MHSALTYLAHIAESMRGYAPHAGLALFLGVIIGWERKRHTTAACVSSYVVLSMTACLITRVAVLIAHGSSPSMDLPAALLTGIGFACSAFIVQRQKDRLPHGITTALTLLAAAVVGIAVGFGLFAMTTFFTLLMVTAVSIIIRTDSSDNPPQDLTGKSIAIGASENELFGSFSFL